MLAELYFNLPMFSAILLLIAGVLLGYALWFPFRGDSESITRRLNELRDQNDDLHQTLRKNREAYAKLEQKYAQQCDELTALQASSERVESALRDHDSVASDLSSSVETIKELKSAAMKQLEVERNSRLALEAQLRKAEESVVDSDQLAAQLKTQGEDYRHLQSKYEMLVEQLEAIKSTNASLTRQCDDLQETVSEKCESLLATEELLANTIVTQDTVEDKLITLQSELIEQREKYQALVDDRDKLAEQLHLQQEQNLELQSQIQDHCHELAERRDANESAVTMRKELSSLKQELDQTRAQLERTVAEHEEAVAACEQAVAERDAVAATVDAVRLDLAHHQRAIETIERHHSKTKSSLSNQAQLQTELEQHVRQHEHTIETLREELVELTMLRQHCITLQTTLQDQETQLKATRLDRDEMAAELAAGKNHWNNIEHRLSAYQLDLDRVQKQREELLARLHESEAQNHDLASTLAEQSERLDLLGPMHTQIDSLADQNAGLESQLEEQHVKIVELTAQRDEAEREASQAGQALTQTMNELTQTRRSIVALERDRDEVSGRLRRQNVMLESHLAKTDIENDERGTAEMAELTRRDQRRGLVYTSAPAHVDDLKQISGVARVLEQRLNEFGIYTYKQIMEWDPIAVEEFSKLLAFRDRIERDNWIGQAAALFQKKHGRAA